MTDSKEGRKDLEMEHRGEGGGGGGGGRAATAAEVCLQLSTRPGLAVKPRVSWLLLLLFGWLAGIP